jgi:PAS domain S-box-containing protein
VHRRLSLLLLTRNCLIPLLLAAGLLIILSACQSTPTFQKPPGLTTIRVVLDNNYPPYTFLDSAGDLQGILVDQWKLWEQKTGIRVQLTGLDWNQALSKMEAGQYDVIDTIFYTQARAQLFDFSAPYVGLDVPIFFSKKISGIVDAASLKGFSIGVKKGDAAIDFLKSKGIDTFYEFNSYEEIIQAARDQKIVVFVVDQPPAMYFLYKLGIQDQFNITQPLYSGEFHRAVLKGNTALLQTVEQGFSLVSQQEYQAIAQKWMGISPLNSDVLRYAGFAALAILVFGLGMVTWNASLRRRVNLHTRKLKTTLDELSLSEQKYHQLVANLPGVVYRCVDDSQWTFRYLSEAVKDLIGYTPDDLLDRPERGLLNLLYPPDREAALKSMNASIARHESFSADYRILTADGSLRWVNNRGQAVIDNDGGVQWIDGVILDITIRIHAEEALRDSEERLRSTIDSMDDLVFVFDRERRISSFYYSAGQGALFRPPDEIDGKRISELGFPQGIIEQFDQSFTLVQHTGESQSFDYQLEVPGGSHWYSARLSERLDRGGQFAGVTAVVGDITVRKQAEAILQDRESEARSFSAQLEELTRVSMELSLVPDTDQLFRCAVEQGSRRLGFDRMGIWLLDETDATKIRGTFGIAEDGSLRDERQQISARDPDLPLNEPVKGEMPFVTLVFTDLLDDREHIVGQGESAAAPLWDGQVVKGYIFVDNLFHHRPIDGQHCEILMLYAQLVGHLSTIKKTEAAIRGLNAELEQRVEQRTAQLELSYREMQSFSYSISHDLRAPLRSLNSFSRILLEDCGDQLDEKAHEYINHIQTASRQLSDLMDALLKLARISRSDIQTIPTRLDLLALEIIPGIETRQPGRVVEWVIQPDLCCVADPILMRVVLENLLGNAWKFTSHHPTARIELGTMLREGQRVFFVRDDGAGFNMEYAGKLFGAFQRLHRMAEFEGTGIGLAIVQRIIQRHGGKIWGESEVEHGATFSFTLVG